MNENDNDNDQRLPLGSDAGHYPSKSKWTNGRSIEEQDVYIKELKKVNEELQQARRAALNLMEDAILSKEALRQSEEKYRTKLEQDVRDRTAELNATKEMLQATLDSSLYTIQAFRAVRDAEGKIVDFTWIMNNQKAVRQHGNVIGKSLLEVNPGVLKAGLFEKFVQVTETGIPVNHEVYYPYEQFDGWVQQTLVKMGDGFVMNTMDITEKEKAEEEIRKSHELFKITIDSSLDMIQVFEAVRNEKGEIFDFNWVLNNEMAESLYGDVIGKSLLTMNPGVVEEGIFDTFKKVVETGVPDQSEHHYVHEQFDGWFYQSTVKLNGGVATTTKDITEWKKAEQEIFRLKDEIAQRATDKYYSIFNSIDEGFCIIEMLYDHAGKAIDFRYLEVNRVYERETGQHDPSGKLGSEVSPNAEPLWLEKYDLIVKTGEPLRFTNYHEDTGRWYDTYASRVGSEGSREVAIIFSDVTERKHAEERQTFLLKLNDALRITADPAGIEAAVSRLAMDHFGTDRCYYCTIEGNNAVIRRDAFSGNLPSVAATYPWSSFAIFKKIVEEGKPLIVDDAHTTDVLDEALRNLCIQLQVISFLEVPVVKSGKVEGVLCLVQSTPRTWKDTEIQSAIDTAERIWEATKRAKIEEALRQSEERFRTLANAVPQVIWANDAEGKAIYFNQRWYEYSGLSYEESLGPGWQVIVHPDDAADSIEKWQRALKDGNVFDTEYRLRNAEGAYRWQLGRNVPLKDDHGGITGWFGSATDIHELKLAEEAIRTATDRLQLALVAGKQGSYEYDFHTGMINASETHKNHYGFSIDEDFSFEELKKRIHPADRPGMEQELEKCIREHQVYAYEYRVRLPNDQIRWIKSIGKGLYHENGEPNKIIGITVDITEEKLFTEELSKQVAERTLELKRSNEDLRQFAHVASHDFKEPVRKVQTFNNRILDEYADVIPPKVRLYCDKIGTATDRILAMIDGVLRYSKLGNAEQAVRPVALGEIISQIMNDLEIVIHQKDAEIKADPLPVIKADPTLIYQLFYNLILNSLKFSKKEVPSLITISSDKVNQEEKKYNRIILTDNGIGFEPEFNEKIFKTFTRLHAAEDYEGTGLGLALCRKIVERHGGSITAHGELDKGATFTILLPEAD